MATRINEVFERVVVLNLDRRADRMAKVDAQLERLGIRYQRFSATDGRTPAMHTAWQRYAAQALATPPAGLRPVTTYREFYLDYDSERARVAFVEQRTGKKAIATPGAFGLLLSMTRIVEHALEQDWSSLLILEDDVRFHRDTLRLFDRCFRQAPPDWAVLQLGAMQLHWEPDWISWCSDHLYRCNGSSIGAHAVGLRRETFQPLLEACAQRELPFDIGALHTIKRQFAARCFTMFPNLAIQDASDSEIGMSTLFFREARKPDNLYRWRLEDYGLEALATGSGGRRSGAPSERPRDQHEDSTIMTGTLPAARLLPRIRRRLDRVLRRFGAGFRPRPPAGVPDVAPPPAGRGGRSSPAAPLARASGPQPLRPQGQNDATCVVVVVVGLAGDQLTAIVERIAGQRGVLPVFLTDCDAFEVFRVRHLAFEYWPPAVPRAGLDWDLYRLRRLALLRRKWRPARIVAFGEAAAGLVDLWRNSPFEDKGIAALTGTRSPTGL